MGQFGIKNQRQVREEYERAFNLFYLSMHLPKKGRLSSKSDENLDFTRITNIAIYDINQNSTSYLFSESSDTSVVTDLIYEVGYNDNSRRMTFNKENSLITNNRNIDERSPFDKLIVCQLFEDTEKQKIWSFTKKGEHQTLIAEIDHQTHWRLDVYNQKIITFKRSVEHVEFNDYDI
ncbi:MAG: hypothetical protein AAFQ94_18090 [Bacteroidota bacterium]